MSTSTWIRKGLDVSRLPRVKLNNIQDLPGAKKKVKVFLSHLHLHLKQLQWSLVGLHLEFSCSYQKLMNLDMLCFRRSGWVEDPGPGGAKPVDVGTKGKGSETREPSELDSRADKHLSTSEYQNMATKTSMNPTEFQGQCQRHKLQPYIADSKSDMNLLT